MPQCSPKSACSLRHGDQESRDSDMNSEKTFLWPPSGPVVMLCIKFILIHMKMSAYQFNNLYSSDFTYTFQCYKNKTCGLSLLPLGHGMTESYMYIDLTNCAYNTKF